LSSRRWGQEAVFNLVEGERHIGQSRWRSVQKLMLGAYNLAFIRALISIVGRSHTIANRACEIEKDYFQLQVLIRRYNHVVSTFSIFFTVNHITLG
jgi:hypothetical protein